MYKHFVPNQVLYNTVDACQEADYCMTDIDHGIDRIKAAIGKIINAMAYDRWQDKHTEADVTETLSDLYSELYYNLQAVAPNILRLANLAERTQREFDYRNSKKAPSVRDWIETEVRLAFHYLWFDDKQEEQQIITQYINEAVDGWTGTDDPMDSENDYLRDKIITYLETEAEKIDEMLSERSA